MGSCWLIFNLRYKLVCAIGGGAGVDDLRGGSGNDLIFTGAGATVGSGVFVSGGGGNDTIFGGSDADDIKRCSRPRYLEELGMI